MYSFSFWEYFHIFCFQKTSIFLSRLEIWILNPESLALWNGYSIVLRVFGLVVLCFLFAWFWVWVRVFFWIIECVGLEGTLGIILIPSWFQPPYSGRGHLSLGQAAQSPTQPCQNFMQETGVVQTCTKNLCLRRWWEQITLLCFEERGVHAVNLSGKSGPKWKHSTVASNMLWPEYCWS